MCGAGLAMICVIVSVVLTFAILLFNKYPNKKMPKVLVINASKNSIADDILSVVTNYCRHYSIKSKNVTQNELNMVIEIRIPDNNNLVNDLVEIDGVESASILTHDGDITVS